MKSFVSMRSIIRKTSRPFMLCILLCAGGWAAAGNAPGPGNNDLSIGNGGARAYFSRQGEWLGMFPAWAGGHGLFDKGGVLVVAKGKNGDMRIIANSAEGNLLSLQSGATSSITCCEGIKGGNRAPALNPDDDSDGRINEDRLDGIDNDGDGLVDEDFAAIGDEMIVSEFETRGKSVPKLRFHQESYAWALSHIEGMVAIRVLIENAGTEPLEEVCIGAFLKKSGPFALSEELFTNRANMQVQPQQAHAAVGVSPGGPAVALLFPDMTQGETEDGTTRWTIWSAAAGEEIASVLGGIWKEDAGYAGALPGSAVSRVARDHLAARRIQQDEQAVFGGLSPSLGTLEPGETVEATVFLVGIQNADAVERTLVDVHRTYLGDGAHRFIPPPVPVTPVVVWGSYERIDEPEKGLRIVIEKDPAKNMNFNSVSFISGVDAHDIKVSSSASGEAEVSIFGKSAQRILKKAGDRLVLKGRDESGVFFDAILSARRSASSVPSSGVETAETYWKTPGKLSEELLLGSPNPFREQTSIYYEVPAVVVTEDGRELKFWGTEETSLKVYDVTGRLVNILVDETKPAGHYRIDWQATDENDIPVASGVYYIKLQVGKRYITKRILLLK